MVALLDRSGAGSRLLVSDISHWEVAVKVARGKLSLAIDVAAWLQRAETVSGVRLLPINWTVLFESTRVRGVPVVDARVSSPE